MNIINGKQVDQAHARAFLNTIEDTLSRTLAKDPLCSQMVVAAADTLSRNLDAVQAHALLFALGVSKKNADIMVAQVETFLSREYLEKKLLRELGDKPFEFNPIDGNTHEKFVPLGVLTHISAGNAAGLPAFSVLEGLLTGNINLLKLPGSDDGLSTALLMMLIDIQPRLSEYIYVFDLPSLDVDAIKKMLAASDAVAVWGSDFAVSGIRSIAPPGLQIIEWGHKLSFACVTKAGESPDALEGIAKDICESEQLLCSSPQCIYFETDNFEQLQCFGQRFSRVLENVSKRYPAAPLERDVQAEITSLIARVSLEELLQNKKVIGGHHWNIIIDEDDALCASPKFRNIFIKPMQNQRFADTLRTQKGYLQTVGLACTDTELDALSHTLFTCGVCRIMPCGSMASNYAGEPHDGQSALRRYVRTVVLNNA